MTCDMCDGVDMSLQVNPEIDMYQVDAKDLESGKRQTTNGTSNYRYDHDIPVPGMIISQY